MVKDNVSVNHNSSSNPKTSPRNPEAARQATKSVQRGTEEKISFTKKK